jgi:uncharacterized membrane protein
MQAPPRAHPQNPPPDPYTYPPRISSAAAPADPYGLERREREKEQRAASAKTIAWIIYGLQILSFLYFIPGIVGLILGYAKRDDARGTWVESHFDWQISTFWQSLLWGIGVAVLLLFVVLGMESVVLGTVLGYGLGLGVAAWYLWRVIKGALALNDNRPIR